MGSSRSQGSRTSRSGAKEPKAVRSHAADRIGVKVTFVVHGGEVLAIFRAIRDEHGKWLKESGWWDRGTHLVACYAHVGQHGECDDRLLKCRRATPSEYLPLLEEMRDIVGYDVDVVQDGKLSLKKETCYAACYLDDLENVDAGIYKVFRRRGAALDFLVEVIFNRARNLGVDVIDMEGYESMRDREPRKMTPDEVRDALADGSPFVLGLEFDSFRTATKRTSMWVEEVTIG